LYSEKVKKWEQEKSSIFQNNIDIDKLNFTISKLENVDQQNVNQNYINTLVTEIRVFQDQQVSLKNEIIQDDHHCKS
jgi:predicted  nucleic acid-binding Zn-ribbon protein